METYEGSLQELKEEVQKQDFLLLYFYNDHCQPCVAIRPKVEALSKEYPELKLLYVNSEKNPELNGAFNVFSNPVIILFVQGKESTRFSKYVSTDQLKSAIDRPYRIIYS